jgi:hypothetical protein
MIFEPRGMGGISIQMFWRDGMMLAADHTPEAGEIAFRKVCVDAVVAVGVGMVDTLRLECRRQHIPMRPFVSGDDGALLDTLLCEIDALGLAQKDAGHCAPSSFAQSDDDPSLACPVLEDPTKAVSSKI